MTLTFSQILLYAGGLIALFMTPGPVWLGVIARSLTGGFRAAWPLALGVVIGDVLWALLAVFGVTWILTNYGQSLELLKLLAAVMFILMGLSVLYHSNKAIDTDNRLTRPGLWAGFLAGLAVILGNPKAILFYMGMMPSFFDVTALSWIDICVIVFLSAVIPFAGNLIMAGCVTRMKKLASSPEAMRKLNICAGILLILVGLIIPFV